MVHITANLVQFLAHPLETHGTQLAIARQIQNADDTVFHQRTGGYFQLVLVKKSQRRQMVNVCLVKQRNPHINVKQVTQIKCPLDPSEHARAQK